MRRFQWVKFNGQMMAHLLYDADAPSRGNGCLGAVAEEHIIAESDYKLSIDELIAKYPAPAGIVTVLPPETPLPKPLMPRVPIE